MSSNFFNIDIITKKSLIQKNNMYLGSNKKILEKQKNVNKSKKSFVKNNNMQLNFSENIKHSENVKKISKKSLFLLDMLKKQTKKNIFKKYNIHNLISLENNRKNIIDFNNNKIFNNILMKKKFLITPLHIFSKIQ